MTVALFLTVVGLGGGLWYVLACAWFPFAACRKCDGAGKFRSKSGKAWRRCRRCRGSGERIRLGRKIWKYFAAKRREAKS